MPFLGKLFFDLQFFCLFSGICFRRLRMHSYVSDWSVPKTTAVLVRNHGIYIYGETHGSVPKPRFVSVFEGSESRLSIPFRFVRNGRNISYQFKKQNNFHLISNLGPFRIFRLNFGRNVPVSFHMFRSVLEKPLNQIEPGSI